MRLIDADKLREHRRRAVMFYWSGEAQEDVVTVSEIDNAPTIEPDSIVKRGRWIYEDDADDGFDHHICSACQKEANFFYLDLETFDEGMDGEWQCVGKAYAGISEFLTDYCPNCGARMIDGEAVQK